VTVYLIAFLALCAGALVALAYRAGKDRQAVKDQRSDLDALETARRAEDGVARLPPDVQRDRLRDWTR
jgi:hypothetical protein